MQIRRARAADIAALLPLVHALASHHGDEAKASPASLFADAFGPGAVVQILLAEVDREIAAYAAMIPLIQLQHGRRGFDLHHLFVADGHRGKGLGKALITAAKAHARKSGAVYLTVGTTTDNKAAQDYYLSQGAEVSAPANPRFFWQL